MKAGPVLCGVALLCIGLVGPFGPCGPSSALGLPLFFGGVLLGGVGWCVSIGALFGAVWSGPRRELVYPALVGTALVTVLGLAWSLAGGDSGRNASEARTTMLMAGPPMIAASVSISRWWRQAVEASRRASEQGKNAVMRQDPRGRPTRG